MENELPKTEVAATEAVGGEKQEATVATEPSVVVAMGETKGAVAKKVFMAQVNALKVCVAKMSQTTKSFIIVFAVFVVVLGVVYYYKGVFIAATINGSPVSRLSVVRELEKKSGKEVLDTIITKKLIADEVKKAGVVIKSEDIDADMQKIEAQVVAQGMTLETALAGQGMTVDDLREQIRINKELEQILADKLVVSDDEINQYLSANKTLTPKGTNSEDMKAQVREQLKGQKFNTEAAKWVSDLKASAKIDYFTQY
ncbi:MAG: hypothetical protein WAV46_03185 [Candidatus Moraniibacteriota bacterium]